MIVDFWAEWCGPCHAVAPVLDRIVEERAGELKLVKVNIDEERELAERYGIASIPTMILFRDGEPAAVAVGAQPKGALERSLGLVSGLALSFSAASSSGCGTGDSRTARRFLDQVQHAHAVDEDDRAAEPAADRRAAGSRRA